MFSAAALRKTFRTPASMQGWTDHHLQSGCRFIPMVTVKRGCSSSTNQGDGPTSLPSARSGDPEHSAPMRSQPGPPASRSDGDTWRTGLIPSPEGGS